MGGADLHRRRTDHGLSRYRFAHVGHWCGPYPNNLGCTVGKQPAPADELTELLDGSDALSASKRAELRNQIRTMPGLHRFLRVTTAGLLRIDSNAVRRQAYLDGKWLLRCSDASLSPEDIAAGYKQLLEVERGWRDMKTHLDLRPVHHRKEERIRAHVLLCWLALLLIRIAEDGLADRTWRRIRDHLHPLHLGVFTGNAGQVHQRTELTGAQRDIYRALDVAEPPRYLNLAPASG